MRISNVHFWIVIQWNFDVFSLKQQIEASISHFCMQINAYQAHLRKKSFQMKEPFPYLFELTSINTDNINRIISKNYRNRLISITAPVKSYSLITNDNFFTTTRPIFHFILAFSSLFCYHFRKMKNLQ